jgi:hypothetical protein
LQGVCIDVGETTTLRENQEYFLFDHGPNNYYVSRFDNVNAHFGSYEKKHFEKIEDVPQQSSGRYLAKVAHYNRSFRIGDEYLISEPGANGYYNVYLLNGRCIGSYIENFFEVIEPFIKPLKTPEIEPIEEPGVNTLIEVKTAKNEPEPPVKLGQITIFDLL